MLATESVPTLPPVPGIDAARLRRAEPRAAAQHRDPPPLPPDRHRRLAEAAAAADQPRRRAARAAASRSPRLAVAIAAWMAYLVRASDRFGRAVAGRGPRGRPRRRHRRPHRRRPGGARRRHPRARHRLRARASPPARSSARRSPPRSPGSSRPTRWPSDAANALTRERDEARTAHRPVPRHAAARGRRLGEPAPASRRWRSPAGRAPPARPAATPAPATSTSPTSRRPRRSEIVAALAERGLAISAPRLLPEPAAPGPGPPRGGDRPPEAGDRRREPHGRRPRQHLLRRRRREDRRRQLAGGADRLARHRRLRPRPGREARLRELPDDLQRRRMAGRPQHRLFAADLAPHPRGLGRRRRHELRPLAPRLADDRPGPLHRASSARTSCTPTPRT